jgi:peptide/nickel transport system substrate-binding protein
VTRAAPALRPALAEAGPAEGHRNRYRPKGEVLKINHLAWGTTLAAAVTLAAPVMAQERVASIEILTTTESYDPIRYEGAFIIAEAWRELGLDVTVSPLEFRTLLDRFYSEQDFDTVILGWSGRVDRLDPQFFLGTLDSRQTGLGANNPGGYENPEYDELFDAQSREFDIDERQRIVIEMQDLYMPTCPW